MKRSVNILVIAIFLIFSILFVTAQPPQASQIVLNLESGIAIETPHILYHEQNQSYIFYFHLFNITTGFDIDNSSATCEFELYNKTGNHLFENDEIPFEGNDFYIFVDEGNFSTLGEYQFLIYCEASDIAGSYLGGFEVTPNGQSFNTEDSLFYLTLILCSMFLFILCLYGAISLPYKNPTNDENMITAVSNLKYFKVLLWGVSYLMFVWLLNLIHNFSVGFASLEPYTNFFGLMFKIMSVLAYPLLIFIIIFMFVIAVKDSKIRKLLDRGFGITDGK